MSGQRVTAARVDGGRVVELGELMDWYERGSSLDGPRNPKVVTEHNAILEQYGLTRSDRVLADYDIYIDVEPFDGASDGKRRSEP